MEGKKNVIEGNECVEVKQFMVCKDDGKLLVQKIFETWKEANKAMGKAVYLEAGMIYADAQFPQMADKNKASKANAYAHIMQWIDDGKPVKVVKKEEEVKKDEKSDAGSLPGTTPTGDVEVA